MSTSISRRDCALALLVALGACGSDASAPASSSFYDPAAPENVAAAFATARQHGDVRFMSLQGTPGAAADTYFDTPWTWQYVFTTGSTTVSVVEPPGAAPGAPAAGGSVSLAQADFAATVPLDLTQLLAKTRLDAAGCPMWPIVNSRSYIRLQGGVKSGSGAVLWFWTFACNNAPVPHWFDTNGDPITE